VVGAERGKPDDPDLSGLEHLVKPAAQLQTEGVAGGEGTETQPVESKQEVPVTHEDTRQSVLDRLTGGDSSGLNGSPGQTNEQAPGGPVIPGGSGDG
jgi:hypothetical protein